MKIRLACVLMAGLAGLAAPAAADPFCHVVAPPDSPPLVRQAAAELSGYLERLTGAGVPVRDRVEADSPAIVLRVTAGSGNHGLAAEAAVDASLIPHHSSFVSEEYWLIPVRSADPPRLLIRGRTPQAVLHGAYRLLREYGMGFYLDGDALPAEPPGEFLLPRLHGSPVFAIRGSLPWYNFFNSPTTWDEHDFRFFADQIVRSGQNFIGFHSYDFEPFAAYDYNGQIVGGEPLMTTAQPVWGTHPMRVDEFGFGTARFFPGEHWGSDAARRQGSREERIRTQKGLLARGLAYASARGVKTCLGFEVAGDPTDVEEQRRFRERLLQLLRDYPMLDYVWLWQPEARSLQGTEPPPPGAQGDRLYREWEAAFADLDTPARRWEGMRVAGYGRLAQRLLDAVAPSVRLVLSGWGGDHWLHVSDYFPAWDRVLDRRIIFAALDDIRVGPTVSRYYDLPRGRERWAIPWYEYDGDQWFPQANAHIFTQTVRDARAKGCQGLLGIHWRTKEVGESQALVAQYAWNPEETLDEFYRDYGIRRAGPAAGPELGAVLQALDALGYRWLGGPGQAECGAFAWCHVADEARERAILALRARLADLRDRLDPARSPSGAPGRLDDLLATVDRSLRFNRIAGDLVTGGRVDQALALDPADPARRERCARLLAELTGPGFGEMLDLYARTITSRGELGVLATVNAKAFFDYRDKVARLREACGQPADTGDLVEADPGQRGLLSDHQLTSAPSGEPLAVRCVAYQGGEPARRAWLEYAVDPDGGTAGAQGTDWADFPMQRVERSVFEVTLPADLLKPGILRYRIVAELSDGVLHWPALRGEAYRQVHLFDPALLVSRRNEMRAAPAGPADALRLTARVTEQGLVRLDWAPAPGMAEIAVERRAGAGQEWQPLGRTLDDAWLDAGAPPKARLSYRLLAGDGGQRAQATIATPTAPPPTRPGNLTARARGPSVRLRWSGDDLTVGHYTVERARSAAGPWEVIEGLDRLAPAGRKPGRAFDRPPWEGSVLYRVRALGRDGKRAALSEVAACQISHAIPPPLLDLDFEQGRIEGPVEFSGPHRFETEEGRGILRTQGGFAIPYRDAIAVRDAFTVVVRFRQAEATPIPVLACQGAWQGDGWFVQLLGSQLRFYLGGAGTLDCPHGIGPGTWHTVVCVYDGLTLSSYLDGRLLAEQDAVGPFRPSTLPFTVARYSQVGPEWTFKGGIDVVRLYDRALDPESLRLDRPGAIR